MTGLTTHGNPTAWAPARSSSSEPANRWGEVGRPRSSLAKRRSASRSMQIEAMVALGTTWMPARSASKSTCVAIASISGMMMSGSTPAMSSARACASLMSSTCASCATCCAGAPS